MRQSICPGKRRRERSPLIFPNYKALRLPGPLSCSDNADLLGLADRGRIALGARADIIVIDYDGLTLHTPHVVHDLPGGGRRLSQQATSYRATLAQGVVTRRDGAATGARPGRLIRAA
ncbi:amidohydrolase family protein [Sphingobium aromaticiconvertens]|uniref:amidohydrolase family protein n=1 Tax=Sphingobium aromaticiconvertens TaxID=365341 RepID=UPI00301819FE